MKDANDIQQALARWLESTGHSSNYQLRPLSGGDINDTCLLTPDDGGTFCIKQNQSAPADFFACEAQGLAAIAATGTVRVPKVFVVHQGFLLMEYLRPAPPGPEYWSMLGAQLARMHSLKSDQFGFNEDNYCGRMRQINTPGEDGYRFFGEHRLLYQGKLALDHGELNARDFDLLQRFVERLPDLIPQQAPALLHGDLWSGNVHSDENGEPALIDPAVYWGWPEADLAMTLLFGGFSEDFYRSYEVQRPLDSGWRDRAEIYNVYHLLNHANHFGGGYGRRAISIVRRYVS